MTVHLEIPDELLTNLIPAGQDPACVILQDSVAEAFREGRLSIRDVAALLHLGDTDRTYKFLAERNINEITIDELKEQLAALQMVRAEARQKTAA